MAFESIGRWDLPFNDMKELISKWEDFVDNWAKTAPPEVRDMYPACFEFRWFDTQSNLRRGAYLSIFISLGAAAFILLIVTLNIQITLFACLCVFTVLASVGGTVVLLGWDLGFLEAICFCILIGLSIDFVAHMVQAYSNSIVADKFGRLKDAMLELGVSILAGTQHRP